MSLISTENKYLVENHFKPPGPVKCQSCRKAKAEIRWICLRIEIEDDPDLLLCGRCARNLALGLLRDVLALEVGEEKAQSSYVDLMNRHGLFSRP